MAQPVEKRRILLITGAPGSGKTTLIRRLAAALTGHRIGGFYTEELREAGTRKGFRLVGFQGEEGVIAHVDFDHRRRVSKYGVNVAAIDRLAEATLTLSVDADVWLVDEIGKMECMSPRFIDRVQVLLDSGRTVIATVAKKGSGLIEQVKQRPDAQTWELTRANRDVLVAKALEWLGHQ